MEDSRGSNSWGRYESPCGASARLLEPLQVFGKVAGALTDPWRGCWCLHRVSTRVLVPSQDFGEGSGVCRRRWRLWREEKRRKEGGDNSGLGF